jgi:hypothetical protein
MSLYTVKVFLDTQATPPVTVRPNSVDVAFGDNQEVQWVLGKGQKGIITGVKFNGATPFNKVRPKASNNWTGKEDNDNRSGAPLNFAYTVVVTLGGTKYKTDPEVANQTGGPCVMRNMPQ